MNRDDLPAEVAALVAEARNKALDEAAGIAREYAAIARMTDGPSGPEPEAGAADAIGRAIRALKEAGDAG